MKVKLKRKKRVLSKWWIFTILVLNLVLISSSYALWHTELYIKGQVSGKMKMQMPVELTPISGTDKYVEDIFGENVATISEQYIDENVLIVNHKVTFQQGTPQNNLKMILNFKNTKEENLINGTTSIEVTGETIFRADPTATTTQKVNINSNGTVTINFGRIQFNNFTDTSTCSCIIKLTYTGETTGKPIEFYIRLNFAR